MSRQASRRWPGARKQRGNALILALLALVVMGVAAAASLQTRQLEAKRSSGIAEATVLESLRNAAQSFVYEHLTTIQQGQPIEKGGVVVTPEQAAGELTWSPTIDQLRDMGYLPSGWATRRSSLNDGPYGISFHRIPSGCAPAACDVQGLVVLGAPLLDGGRNAPVDGVVIGPILTRAGADGGVSLLTAPATISGFHGTWSAPNPLPTTPAGVVALRFGTQTGGFSQFVRVGDLRDPVLRGNLSAEGNLSIGQTATFNGTATFLQDANMQGELRVGPNDAPCLTGTPRGVLTLGCDGRINAASAVFSDPAGNRSSIEPAGLFSTGRVEAQEGIRIRENRLFEANDPRSIHMAASELDIKSSDGLLASFRAGNFAVPSSISAQSVSLDGSAVEGGGCHSESTPQPSSLFSATAEGALAACVGGRWVIAFRTGRAGQLCGTEGSSATDSIDGNSLICKLGSYVRANALLSNFVLIRTVGVQIVTGPVRIPKPNCPSSGAADPVPLIILSPNSEDAPAFGSNGLSGINRFAFDDGADWVVYLERSADFSPLGGRLIANIYCFYG